MGDVENSNAIAELQCLCVLGQMRLLFIFAVTMMVTIVVNQLNFCTRDRTLVAVISTVNHRFVTVSHSTLRGKKVPTPCSSPSAPPHKKKHIELAQHFVKVPSLRNAPAYDSFHSQCAHTLSPHPVNSPASSAAPPPHHVPPPA